MTRPAFCYVILAPILTLLIPGAISAQSIHPFFQEDDVVFKSELLGEWKIGGEAVEFRDLGDKTYGAVLGDSDGSAVFFRVHLFRIEQSYFIDAQVTSIRQPEPTCADPNDGRASVIPVTDRDFELNSDDSFFFNHQHLLIRASFGQDKNEFLISFLNEDWVRTQGGTGKLPVAHTKDDSGRLLFVAESDDLRVWVRELPDEAFEGPDTMRRPDGKENAGTTMAPSSAP